MPPTSFAELSLGGETGDGADTGDRHWTEDEAAEALPAEDEESILSECVQARVPQRWLSWHYRSQDESLIAFSNRQYYAGGLSSFPAPQRQRPTPCVNHIHVADGHFFRSGGPEEAATNPREADAVVSDVIARFRANPAVSVGVVTFNTQQRDLIRTRLLESGDPDVVASVESEAENALFIKNLENVQGDERDVIIFSLGFSKNDRGVLPLNFGPLNRAGGERRLNVAVTRARQEIRVFSSFLPSDMRIDSTESRGVRHLHDYLVLAAKVARTSLNNSAERRILTTVTGTRSPATFEHGVGRSAPMWDCPTSGSTSWLATATVGRETSLRCCSTGRDGRPARP